MRSSVTTLFTFPTRRLLGMLRSISAVELNSELTEVRIDDPLFEVVVQAD
jgi:hypothetical protein